MVARLVWDQDAAGSSPVAPTKHSTKLSYAPVVGPLVTAFPFYHSWLILSRGFYEKYKPQNAAHLRLVHWRARRDSNPRPFDS